MSSETFFLQEIVLFKFSSIPIAEIPKEETSQNVTFLQEIEVEVDKGQRDPSNSNAEGFQTGEASDNDDELNLKSITKTPAKN